MLLTCAATARAELLCPEIANSPAAEGSRMSEDTFEAPQGLDAAEKLLAFLNTEKLQYDFGQVLNAFVAKGVILRQRLEIARQAAELARRGAGGETAKAEAVEKQAREAFCRFMQDAVVAE
jgi:hypothetical protein